MEEIFAHLVDLVEQFGYLGLFIATLIESTFVPIPAEVTMIPAGKLAALGKLSYWGILFSATAGVIAGSMLNYWIGIRFGRALLINYGKYIFLKPSSLKKTERFFKHYGALAVFIGRLLPGIKHYISFVAGLASMNFRTFVTYTALGGLIWIWLLLQVSYMAALKAEATDAGSLKSLEWVMAAVVVISLAAWFVKARMMKHAPQEEDDHPG